jgi:hypothetical protein
MNYYYKILMNLHRKPIAIYIGLLLYPCIPLTTKHTQSIGWEPVANINHTDNCSAGLDVICDDNNEGLMDLD